MKSCYFVSASSLEFLQSFRQIFFMLVKYLISYFEFAKFDCSDHTLSFFIRILFTRIPWLIKRLRNKNYSGIMLTFFFFQTRTVFFKPSFKYHVAFQDQSEANIREDDWVDCTLYSLYLVYKFKVRYTVFKKLHYRKYYENYFFASLQIFIVKNTKALFGKYKRIIYELFKAQNPSFDKNLEAQWNSIFLGFAKFIVLQINYLFTSS